MPDSPDSAAGQPNLDYTRAKCARPAGVLKKQISLFIPQPEYLRLRDHAIRRRIPLTSLLRELMEPEYSALVHSPP